MSESGGRTWARQTGEELTETSSTLGAEAVAPPDRRRGAGAAGGGQAPAPQRAPSAASSCARPVLFRGVAAAFSPPGPQRLALAAPGVVNLWQYEFPQMEEAAARLPLSLSSGGGEGEERLWVGKGERRKERRGSWAVKQ